MFATASTCDLILRIPTAFYNNSEHRRRNHKISGGANDIMSQNIILNYLSCHSIINEYVNNYTSSLYKIVRSRYIIWGRGKVITSKIWGGHGPLGPPGSTPMVKSLKKCLFGA